jgi:DNA (cytosine-5)-methyltransferase 1
MSLVRARSLISLFTGAGGMDYGFEAARFTTRAAVEIDAACAETLRHNRPGWPVINKDVAEVSTKEILDTARLRVGEVDVLVGGPPCQPFSKLGYWARGDAKRLTDPRARTIDEMLRVVGEALPRVMVMENVQGLAFDGKDEALRKIERTLTRINRQQGTSYKLSAQVLRAADYGVPQLRDRLFLVADQEGRPFEFPAPTHAADPAPGSGLSPYRTAWDAFRKLTNDRKDLDLEVKGRWADLLPTIPEGENYLFHTSRGKGVALFGWRRRYWSFLLKLSRSKPSWTLPASSGPANGPFHWENRRLSMREMCRLQTFPDDVVILGAIGTVQRQVGNAVPSLFTEVLGREIRRQLFGEGASTEPLQRACDRGARRPAVPDIRQLSLADIPNKYWHLADTDTDHPGTGRGRRAAGWSQRPLAAE